MFLRLVFEGTDREALKGLAQASARPRTRTVLAKVNEAGVAEGEQEEEQRVRMQSPNWRDAPGRDGIGTVEDERKEEEHDVERDGEAEDAESRGGRERRRTADDDEVVLKEPQPKTPGSPGEAPSTPLYTRSVTLGIKDRTASQIWNWFKMRTNCTDVPRSHQDQNDYDKLSWVLRRSAWDRERVKKGVDERKANDEMLRRARGEAEKLQGQSLTA
jgi:hypothetical protein